MFAEVAALGSLDVQLTYFRGMKGSMPSARLHPGSAIHGAGQDMGKIRCETGYTQIGKVLSHVSRESRSGRSTPWFLLETPERNVGCCLN